MNEVIEFRTLGNFLVWLKFSDSTEKEVDLKPFIGKGFTNELLVPDKFNQVFIEPGGGLAWPNGYDICPNFLKELQDARHMA